MQPIAKYSKFPAEDEVIAHVDTKSPSSLHFTHRCSLDFLFVAGASQAWVDLPRDEGGFRKFRVLSRALTGWISVNLRLTRSYRSPTTKLKKDFSPKFSTKR